MAFTGTAVYDIFNNEIAEDVSEVVSMISPRTARFLDDLPQADYPVVSKAYSWEEDRLLPDTYAVSSAIASTAAASGGIEVGADVAFLRVKDILEIDYSKEKLLVTSIGASNATIYVTRAYAGTTANSAAAGATLNFLGSAVEEGSGARQARRVGKSLKYNYVQEFREDINISNLSQNAGFKVKSEENPYDKEVAVKTTEVVKQLEKAVLLGRTNGNTIGAGDKETTMAGIINSVVTNITSHGTYTNSILGNMLAQIDRYTDLRAVAEDSYGLYCGSTAYRLMSQARATRIEEGVDNSTGGVKPIEYFYSDFGKMPVKAIRWIPAGTVLCLRKDFVRVRPFAGNSFGTRQYDDGSTAKKGYVYGCYGLEFHQEKAHGMLTGVAA